MKKPLIRRLGRHLLRYRIRYTLLAVLCIGLLCKLGEWEASRLECNTTRLPAEALPGAGPMRIALLSDIHNNKEQFEKIVTELRKQKPDLIVFCGDLVTYSKRFSRTRWAIQGFRELGKIAPTFAVFGNHDYEMPAQVERVFRTAGVRLLRNEALDWTTPSGKTLRLIGLGDWNEGDEAPETCMSPEGAEEKPVLLLSHDPESRWLLRQYDWNLMLSGHNHGGQLGIPFTDTYVSFRSSMPAGLHDFEGNRRVFVSRGIGSIYDMRFFCVPEINILDIAAESKTAP